MIKWDSSKWCEDFSTSTNQSMWYITLTNGRIEAIWSSQWRQKKVLTKFSMHLLWKHYRKWAWREHTSTSVQFISVTQSCLTRYKPMDCSTPGLPVHHQLPEFTQTHVHWVGDAIQPSHSLSAPSPPAFNLSQHQGLFKWVRSLYQVAKVLEFQLQHQSFQWIFRTDFL